MIEGRERLFRTVDKQGNFLWWECMVNYGDNRGWWGGAVDFSNGSYLGLTETDKIGALNRTVKNIGAAK